MSEQETHSDTNTTATTENEQSSQTETTTATVEGTSGTTTEEQTKEETSGTTTEEQTKEETSGTTTEEQTKEETSGTTTEEQTKEETSGTTTEEQTREETSGTTTEQPAESNAEQSAASNTEQSAASNAEQSAADNAEEPAKTSAPAKKEDKVDTKLPKEFKRGYDISHYQLERLLDNQKGLFLFAATNHKDDEAVTLRIERIDPKHPGLLTEIAAIPYLSESLSFPRFYEWGEQNGFRWVSCELLGPSLKFVKWKLPHQRFTQYSALHGSLALLRCIEDLHKRGFVHGDIQPDNILVRPNKEHPLVLSNFQMAKRYCWPEGVKELPPLDQTPASIDISKIAQNNEIVVEDDYGFKAKENSENQQQSESQTNEASNADNNNENSNADGSTEENSEGPQIRDPTIFDSVNALQGGEVTRVDDLESWFYIMVDMLEGKLPFSSPSGQSATRESILSAKQGVSAETLTKDLPDKLKDLWTYISSLTPTDEPDYDKIGKSIVDTIQELKLIPDDYDWNKLPVRKVKKISAIDFRALNGETNYLPIFDHERNVSQTPPPPPSNCLIA